MSSHTHLRTVVRVDDLEVWVQVMTFTAYALEVFRNTPRGGRLVASAEISRIGMSKFTSTAAIARRLITKLRYTNAGRPSPDVEARVITAAEHLVTGTLGP